MTVQDDFFDYEPQPGTNSFATGDTLLPGWPNAVRQLLDPLDRTPAEIAAGVTPTAQQYPVGDVRRYGGGPSATHTVNNTAIANTLLVSQDVVLPYESGSDAYDVSQSFVLGLWGQRIRGLRIGEPVSQADAGVVLNVVSGFPVAGGDAAQSVIQITDRYQSVSDLAIDCNGIAAHGLYGTGSDVSFGTHEYLNILDPAGDGVLFVDDTWMNTFRKIRVTQPAGYGFNFDTVAGSGHTTTVLEQCYVPDLAAGTGDTVGAFRFDGMLGAHMIACGGDNIVNESGGTATGVFLTAINSSVVIVTAPYTESTVRLASVDGTSKVSISGGRLINYGHDTHTVASLFDNSGILQITGMQFQSGEALTAFGAMNNGSKTDWRNNNLRLIDQTNTIGATAEIEADNVYHQSAVSTASQRYIVEGTSPGLTLRDTDQGSNLKNIHIDNVAGDFSIKALNDAFANVATLMRYTRSTSQWVLGGILDKNFADDAAAAAGNVPVGGLYRNGSGVQIRVA